MGHAAWLHVWRRLGPITALAFDMPFGSACVVAALKAHGAVEPVFSDVSVAGALRVAHVDQRGAASLTDVLPYLGTSPTQTEWTSVKLSFKVITLLVHPRPHVAR